jgi:hypothetical protein
MKISEMATESIHATIYIHGIFSEEGNHVTIAAGLRAQNAPIIGRTVPSGLLCRALRRRERVSESNHVV